MQGPDEDMEEESEFSVKQLQEMARKKAEAKKLAEEEAEKEERRKEEAEKDAGITWGMREDAVEVEEDEGEEEHPDMSKNPFGSRLSGPGENEKLYSDDPKRALRRWFEREGFELDFVVEDKGRATFECRVELPLDAVEPGTAALTAQATVKGGKKKEAVVQCALEACR